VGGSEKKYMHAFEQAFEIDRTSESYFKQKRAVWRLSSVVTNLKTVGLSYSPIVATNFEIRYIRAGEWKLLRKQRY